MRIAVDFDGTLVEHEYPDIGKTVPGAFKWLRKWKEAGAQLILWTMRADSEKSGPVLADAVAFCRRRGVEFDGVNEGIGDREWTDSPKAYANIYVDDAAFGCPLVESKKMGRRPMVDWSKVGPEVMAKLEAVAAKVPA